MVNDKQVALYRKHRAKGKSQEAAATRAGMTAKTARKWEVGPLPSEIMKGPRPWRTRNDPLEEVWENRVVVPFLKDDEEDILEATSLLEHLKTQAPGVIQDMHLRTLQRRIRDWKAVHGAPTEVFFEQVHVPGREAQFDFTNANELNVTIAGEPFPHMFFELILTFSKHRYVEIARGETFEALCSGLQNAFWTIGGVTEVGRSDNLSAATHELALHGGRELTPRFRALLEHYGMESTRIRPRKSNENGVVEKGHDVLKKALRQALFFRGSRDFATLDEYRRFVQVVVDRLNQKKQRRFAEEILHLRPLPTNRIPMYTDIAVTVLPWSYIRVARNIYSVNSRLIGHKVVARLHADEVEVFYNGRVVDRFPRLRGQGRHRIDYRHVVFSLVQKPGAFARYRFREEMFPSLVFRRAYDALTRQRGERADIEYLRVLRLAATTFESEVEAALSLLLETSAPFDYADVQSLVSPKPSTVPVDPKPMKPDLKQFDNLLTGGQNEEFTANPPLAYC